ncbi:hypothetical protein C8K30_1011064 [Promicromonospora sp. AC04]|uniref:hypothetical protein n=1 Tax=Promicromonospora sp. AC04 TaxID=2135723 RepID=UPI000D36525F|nr:hypothetical protein [Promicromonospora sp. AC04]PUB32538.1 hypothetical protein C8K30_1011064 [Promicromonospora sp. AC04]
MRTTTSGDEVDTLTPAFREWFQDPAPGFLDLVYRSTGRHRLLGGKSARLLRAGDLVAVRDLHPDRDERPGMAAVIGTHISPVGIAFVSTAEHGLFPTPGSRLVLVHRAVA